MSQTANIVQSLKNVITAINALIIGENLSDNVRDFYSFEAELLLSELTCSGNSAETETLERAEAFLSIIQEI